MDEWSEQAASDRQDCGWPTSRDLGDLIRSERTARGLSQEGLAQAAGISQTQVSRIERGLGCAERTLEAIAALLNLSSETLDDFSPARGRARPGRPLSRRIEDDLIPAYRLACWSSWPDCPTRPGLAWECARCAERTLARDLSEEEISREERLLAAARRIWSRQA